MGLFLPPGSVGRSLLRRRAPQQRFWFGCGLVTAIALACGSATFGQSLGTIAAVDVKGVSADGSSVVGRSRATGEAFIWTLAGPQSLGFLDSTYAQSTAYAVSADGKLVIGDSLVGGGYYRAFRWMDGDIKALALPSGDTSNAYAVSDSGSIIVGRADATDDGGFTPVYWTDDGDTLHFLDESVRGSAYGVSSTGAVIVGQYKSSLGKNVAFRWTEDGFLDIAGSGTESVARAVNIDGTVVVGSTAGPFSDAVAFRWTDAGFSELGTLPEHTSSIANAVNGAGDVVVGTSWNASDPASLDSTAFYWRADGGLNALADLLADAADLAGWALEDATGVSEDGMVVVGNGKDASGLDIGYIARLQGDAGDGSGDGSGVGSGDGSRPSATGGGTSGVITTDILLRSALSMTALTEAGNDYLDRLLQAHMLSIGDCTECVFSSGLGGTLRGDDPAATLLVGGKRELQPGIRLGGSFASLSTHTPLVYGGAIGTAGNAATLFADMSTAFGLTFSGAISANLFAADIARGYLNGNAPTTSYGRTTGHGVGAALVIAWAYPIADRFTLTPFTGVSAIATQVEGWREAGGPFPAAFDTITDTLAVQRSGAAVRMRADGGLQLWSSLGWAHRYGAATTGISGILLGISDLSVAGAVVEQDWIEVSAGVDFPISNGTATVSGSLTAAITPTETFFQSRGGISRPF